MVGSTRKRTFAPDFSGRGGFAGTSLGESIKPGGDRCISLSRHESLCRLPQRSIAGEELAVELVEAGQRPLDEIRRVELEKRAQRRLRYRHLHFREKIVDGVITGSHRVAEQVPSFEGAVQIGKLFRGEPDDRPYLAAPLQVRIAGPRRAPSAP